MTIFSSFSANYPPHYYTILAINCVHESNWFTHLQRTRQIDGQNDNSVLTVHTMHVIKMSSATGGYLIVPIDKDMVQEYLMNPMIVMLMRVCSTV